MERVTAINPGELRSLLGAHGRFRKVLQRLPRRPVALLGLARAAAAAGNAAEAKRAANEFLQIWRRADADRPELAEARRLAKN